MESQGVVLIAQNRSTPLPCRSKGVAWCKGWKVETPTHITSLLHGHFYHSGNGTSCFVGLRAAVLQDGWEDARGEQSSCEPPRHSSITTPCKTLCYLLPSLRPLMFASILWPPGRDECIKLECLCRFTTYDLWSVKFWLQDKRLFFTGFVCGPLWIRLGQQRISSLPSVTGWMHSWWMLSPKCLAAVHPFKKLIILSLCIPADSPTRSLRLFSGDA